MISTSELDSELSPETLLPEQYSSLWHRRARTEGEVLASAILEQSIRDLRTFRNARRARMRRIHADAHAWICSEDRSYAFSFVNICEVLGICPESLRERLIREPEEQRNALPQAA
jgi:hypothetical protein